MQSICIKACIWTEAVSMEPECRKIAQTMIPAVRVYLAQTMSSRYKLKQREIAARLGIAQVAVSKYLNMRYSASVAKARAEAARRISKTHLVNEILESRSANDANMRIERFCEDWIHA